MTKVSLTTVQAELLAAYAGIGEFPAHANSRTVAKLRDNGLIRGEHFDTIEVTASGYVWLGREDLIEVTDTARDALVRLDESTLGTNSRAELAISEDDEATLVAYGWAERPETSDGDASTNPLIITDRGRFEAKEIRGARKAAELDLQPGDVLTITIPRSYSSRPGTYHDMVIDRLDASGGHVVGPKGYRDTICFGYSALDVWTVTRTGRNSTRCMCPPEVIAGGHWPDCRLTVADPPGAARRVYDVQITLQTRNDDGQFVDRDGPFKFGDKDTRTRAHTPDLFTQIADGWAAIALANGYGQIRVVVACQCGCGLESAVERDADFPVQPLLAPVRAMGRPARVLRTWIHPTTRVRWYEVAFAQSTWTASMPATDVEPAAEFGWGGRRHPVVVEVHENVNSDGRWTHLHTELHAADSYEPDHLDYVAENAAERWARVAGHPVRVAVTAPGPDGAHGYATAEPAPADAAGWRPHALAA